MHSTMMPRWQQRRSRPFHGYSGHCRADSIARTSSSATHSPPPPQLIRRSLPHRIAMDLLGDAARDCAKRSMTSRPCRRPRGRRKHRLRLMQPANAAATTTSRPMAWLASPLAERHQRGAASNVERSTHEAAGRGRRRGRGLVVLLRAAATVSAGARQAGSRDQCRQREACARRLFLSPPARACGGPLHKLKIWTMRCERRSRRCRGRRRLT